MTLVACDAVLFDLDGVLADSTASVEHHWRAWAARHRLDGDALMQVVHGRRAIDSIREFAPHLDADRELIDLAASEAGDLTGVAPLDGAARLVASLPANRWAVVTSGTRPVATARLAHVGIAIPRVLITADVVARGKPDPEGYLAAARALEVPPSRCIVVEDAPPGITAARAANMRSIAVLTTHERHELAIADFVVHTIADIRCRSVSETELVLEISTS